MTIKPHSKSMTSQSPMYIYATEMVSDYYAALDIRGKKVLSIVGSGDQIINAYYFGAKEVIGFDINKRAEFILELKIEAVKNLAYLDFLNFFGKEMGEGTFDYCFYKTFKNSLSPKTRRFFDQIYQEFNEDGCKLIKSDYFRQRSMIKAGAKDVNIYLKNQANYLKCRKILQKVNLKFVKLDINNISASQKIKGKFDLINLSNVLNYLTASTEEKDLLKILVMTMKNISKRLKLGGLFFYYSYTPFLYPDLKREIPPASRLELIRKFSVVSGLKVNFKKIKGVDLKRRDRINIFKIL